MGFSGSTARTPNQPILYNDSALTYLGRWLSGANGKYSGWASSSIQFKVKNTSKIIVKAYINRVTPSSVEGLGYHIDGDPITTSGIVFEASTAAFSGYRTVTLPVPNDGRFHNIILHFAANTATALFNQDTIIQFNSIVLDPGGEISTLTQGAKKLQCIGDSWMATSNDWPRFIDPSLYSCIQIAGSGYTLAVADSRYNYDYNGVLNTTDEIADAALISFGANDFVGGVSVANFQTQLLSLIDKVRLKQPSIPIFLVRVVNNGASLYGQYLTAMNNAAGLRTNIIVIDTTSLDGQVDWYDSAHLGYSGKPLMGSFVKTQLLSNGI